MFTLFTEINRIFYASFLKNILFCVLVIIDYFYNKPLSFFFIVNSSGYLDTGIKRKWHPCSELKKLLQVQINIFFPNSQDTWGKKIEISIKQNTWESGCTQTEINIYKGISPSKEKNHYFAFHHPKKFVFQGIVLHYF